MTTGYIGEVTIDGKGRVAWGKKPPLRDISRYFCISCVSEQISVRKHCPGANSRTNKDN